MERVTKKIEQRRSRRVTLSGRATYEVSAHPTSASTPFRPQVLREAQIQNVSDEGIGLLMKEALKTHEIVKLGLPLPHVEVTMPSLAEVRWVRQDADHGPYRVGLRYLLTNDHRVSRS